MKKIRISILDTPVSPLIAVVVNMLLALMVYVLARIEFLLVNLSYFSEGLTFDHLMEMFYGGYMFDRSAVTYTNLLWIMMMLFPLWLKETPAYHKVCKWLFVVVNSEIGRASC